MARPMRNNKTYMTSLIKTIHVGKRSLGMDDASYRAMLEGQTGKTSCSGMTQVELIRVADHMRDLGFGTKPGTPSAKLDGEDSQTRLIRHLWLELHSMGRVQNPSEQALAAWAKRQTGVDKLEWLNTYQVTQVIEALKAWIDRGEGK